MAIISTIFKANLQISDLDHGYYADHALTLARHPSETDERMMIRLAALAIQAHELNDLCNGDATLAYASLLTGLNKLEINEEALAEDLDAAWEVLAEPIQTVMRRFGVQGAYEKLKEVTRGKTVTAEALHGLIQSLEIPQAEKDRLLAMTPGSYVGKAAELARRV